MKPAVSLAGEITHQVEELSAIFCHNEDLNTTGWGNSKSKRDPGNVVGSYIQPCLL